MVILPVCLLHANQVAGGAEFDSYPLLRMLMCIFKDTLSVPLSQIDRVPQSPNVEVLQVVQQVVDFGLLVWCFTDVAGNREAQEEVRPFFAELAQGRNDERLHGEIGRVATEVNADDVLGELLAEGRDILNLLLSICLTLDGPPVNREQELHLHSFALWYLLLHLFLMHCLGSTQHCLDVLFFGGFPSQFRILVLLHCRSHLKILAVVASKVSENVICALPENVQCSNHLAHVLEVAKALRK
mmetsp:Transcript_25063/g.54535  ORF Transcript_25063/g.54535 Transcript_25063/m.54535 type:complete len:242 (-) Transcript_25063:220-945(-)